MRILPSRAIILDMDHRIRPPLPARNPITQDLHQRQVLWQVFVPMILGAIIVILLGVLVSVAASAAQIVRFSDISIILLIMPTFLVGVLFLAIFGALIFLLAKMIQLLPPYARLAQIYLERFTGMLNRAADMAANPLLSFESKLAGFKTIFQKGMNGSSSSQPAQPEG
jgi:ABC-type dipeptide/oligopeptide/nickel transport system permease component